ncbi:MAG TPA: hypothetical protein VNO30_34865 [Kofleriaceae bacterium]|nr:hypothetical protein [Kofleriaceae bacterium]
MKLAPLFVAVLAVLALAAACKTRHEPAPREKLGSGSAATPGAAPTPGVAPAPGQPAEPAGPEAALPAIARAEFNRWAVRLNLPIYWIADANNNQRLDPDEVAALLFYPTEGDWVRDGKLSPAFTAAYRAIEGASKAPPPAGPDARRQELVGQDLDGGRPTLLRSDLAALPPIEKELVRRMLGVAKLVDALYEKQKGAAALEAQLPPDPASRSLFRRNRGPQCAAPATEKDPACSAIPGAPKPVFDIYPAELQRAERFCTALEKRPDAKVLLEDHFSAVRGTGAALKAVPYTEAYKAEMGAIAQELLAAGELVGKDPAEAALAAYLRAAAASFQTNDWVLADLAWAKMSAANSKWYVRIAPDETYWEPCARKAGLHLTFARINEASKAWQEKLSPVRQEMEQQIAARAGAPYTARKVAFQLPDFIDIVWNAGDDRDPLGATGGQSLPNWGPVAERGGRTVVMSNLYQDADSRAARRAQAESVLDATSMRGYTGTPEPGLLSTILHEATHNLGPSHEYKVAGKLDTVVFGGPLAQVMEELKAQTGALFLVEYLRAQKLISDELAVQAYTDAIVWALGQISLGLYSGNKEPKTYGHVAAIQIGYLLDQGALTWDAQASAANGKDPGALVIHPEKLPAAAEKMMKTVAGIKARGDAAAVQGLVGKYVDGKVVPHAQISERFLRNPKASFVYAISL